ncbi:hypothetical protein [Serratia silvae]|uniref:Uncharacterized protein n=1 Tax=Serratia silvae TaxID=2824122 RepID=A0ABT0KB29_9GAMM|nr:hypothetical protein [Serratia silvae]MCL1029230.1 hypothetical protein [Serratia silvae]
MTNNAIYSVENDKFIFLFNDLTAAYWVLNIEADISDQELAGRFMDIHQVFLGRLGRQEKGGLRKVPEAELIKVVRGWIVLYKCTIALLRRQHPRLSSSRDLVVGKLNWSERLKISASGLLLIDHSSRYAEFWAERAIKTKNGYSSLESRLSFVGSYIYNEYAQMVHKGELLVLDSFSNGVTSYDMMLFLRESHCAPESFLTEIKKIGWRVELGDEASINRIFQLYTKIKEKELHV